jgi:dephospho-CoA kinase
VLRVGLTGGPGSGKSTVGKLLAERGAAVVDTDQLAREMVAPGTPGLAAVVERFGAGLVLPDGSLDRAALAALVFSDASARRDLEAITHPLIRAEAERRLAAAAASGAPVAVVEIPLLDAARRVLYRLDFVVLVEAPLELAVRRAARRGWGEEDVRARMAAQPSDEERRSAADWVVGNAGSMAALRREVSRLWERLDEAARPPTGEGLSHQW